MKRPFSRLLAVAGSIFIGVVGAVALATPAHAHHTTITATTDCLQDGWRITWTVSNGEWDRGRSGNATIKQMWLTPGDSSVDGFGLETKIPANGNVSGEQFVPHGTTSVSLKVHAQWDNGAWDTPKYPRVISLDNSRCGKHEVAITGEADCDGDTGSWVVRWAVTNAHWTQSAKATILSGNTLDGLNSGDTIGAGSTVEATETLPGTAASAELEVQLKWGSGPHAPKHKVKKTLNFEGKCAKKAPNPSAVYAWDCTGEVTVILRNADDATKDAIFVVTGAGGFTTEEITVPVGGESVPVVVPASASSAIEVHESGEKISEYAWPDGPECYPPTGEVADTCDGLVFTFANPENGASTTIKLTPSTGAPIEFTLAPGESKQVEVDAEGDELSVDVTADGNDKGTVAWEKPDDCDEPGLPVTGTQVSLIVTAGVALLGVGAALFFLARRRRITLE